MNFDIKKKLGLTVKMGFAVIFLAVSIISNTYAQKRSLKETSCPADLPEGKRSEVESVSKELKYSINLMWINRMLDIHQRYIYPAANEEVLRKNFLDPIFKWAQLNPDSTVNIWFNRELTTSEAIENTWMLIKDNAIKYPKMAPIVLRNVGIIPKVIVNPEVFSDLFSYEIPVSFRVDLLRPIIALYMLSNNETDYFVYGDLDMEPLSQEQLFDDETLHNLQTYGIVMARGGFLGFEDGFQIISNHNQHLLEAIEWVLVVLNIKRAHNALQGKFYDFCGRQPEGPMKPLQQIIYDTYPDMFKYFYHLEGYGKMEVLEYTLGKDGEIIRTDYRDYDAGRDGLEPFGLNRIQREFRFVSDNEKFLERPHIWVPTKEILLPRSRFHGNVYC